MVGLNTASDADLGRLWPAVNASRLFPSRAEFEMFWEEEPWRVRIDEAGRAVVLERWREHLDILGIKGIWCTQRDLPAALEEVRAVARAQRYGRVLSPLIAEDASAPYTEAGMAQKERIIAMRTSLHGDVGETRVAPSQLELEECSLADRESVAAVDRACFDEFWRHGERFLERSLTVGRTVAARESGQVVGYTWCTTERGIGTLGRIAVAPRVRRQGVGRALLGEAFDHMAREGVGVVSLCTQEHNLASRALYASAGLRELPGRLVLMMQDV